MSHAELAAWPEAVVPGRRGVRQDGRLVPGALAVWGVTIAGLHGAWPGTVAAAAVLLGALLVLRSRHRGSLLAGAVAAAALGVAAAFIVFLRTTEVAGNPVRAAALQSQPAVMTVVAAELPHLLSTPGFAGQPGGSTRVLVPAELRRAVISGRQLACSGRILLLADSTGYAAMLPGQQFRASGLLTPATNDPLTVAVLRVRGPPEEVSAPPWWQRAAAALRAGLRTVAGRTLDEEAAGLLPGLVTGDTSQMPARVVSEFQIAGLTHLNAVSGANVAIMVGAVVLVARLARIGPRLTAFVAGLVLAGFVVVVGPQPSVLRAAVMGGIGLLAMASGRQRSVLPALAASVIALVLLDSSLATSLGYVLSVLATAALVLLAPGWSRALRARGVPPGLAEAVAVPTAAHLATAPLIAAYSGQLSLVAIPANMLAEPVVAPVTVLGVLAMVVAPVQQGAAIALVRCTGPFVHWLINVARRAAALPDSVVPWPAGILGGALLAGALLALVAVLRNRRMRLVLAAVLVGVVVVWLPVQVVRPSWPVSGWAMVSCDVGQGDAEVLATAEPGRAVVVDTGPDPLSADTCLRKLGVLRIPLVVLSHLHADHIGGLSSVLAHRTVGAVALGSSRVPSWAYDMVRRETEAAHVPLVALSVGQQLSWPGLALDVIGTRAAADEADLRNPDGTTVNNTSVVLRASTPAGRVLLTGDVELAAQADLLSAGGDLTADVVKVPHHGSRYSVPAFLAAVHARVALVSVGAGNRYGHPSPLTLGELSRLGATVARTDRDGDIAVLPSDGGGPALVRSGQPRAPPRH